MAAAGEGDERTTLRALSLKARRFYILSVMSVYVLFGPPGSGKSWYVTKVAMTEMRRGTQVFTNFPIIFDTISFKNVLFNIFRKKANKKPWRIINRSFQMKNEYIDEGLYDKVIIVDEAYREFNSHDWKSFGIDHHTFFATNRHNLNDIWVMAQGYKRVNVVIREMANYYVYMRKKSVPFFIPFIGGMPLVFVAEYYLEESDFSNRHVAPKSAEFKKYFFFFTNMATNTAYDTHYFRKQVTRESYDQWEDEREKAMTPGQFLKIFISENLINIILLYFVVSYIYTRYIA